MNKTFLITLGLLAAMSFKSNPVAAQKEQYQLLFDDPLAFKKLFINFNLIRLELANPTEWRPGLGAEFTLNRRLYFFADYNRTVFPTGSDYSTVKHQSYLEAGTVFSFSSKVKTVNTKIKSKGGGYHYTWKIKSKALKQFGVHAGFNSFSTYKKDGDYYAYASTNSIFAGIAVTTTRDMLVKIGDRKSFDRSSRGMWYLDLLIAPAITYTDATDYAGYAGSASTASPLTFPTYTKVPFGARLGYMKYQNWPIPMRAGFETGVRPGIGSGGFFALKLEISIGFMKGKPTASKEN